MVANFFFSTDMFSVDKDSKFKNQDYEFMQRLRSDNSDNRETMTIKLTQKLLENQRFGRKSNLQDHAMQISQKMARTTGEHSAQDKKNAGTLTEADEDEVEKGERR